MNYFAQILVEVPANDAKMALKMADMIQEQITANTLGNTVRVNYVTEEHKGQTRDLFDWEKSVQELSS